MPTVEEYAKQPFEARLARMAGTPDELAAAILDQSDAALSRRPDPKNWAAKEVVSHFRDTEEVFFVRFHAIVENDEPRMYFDPGAAERFAEDRQYSRSDGREALAAFRRRRAETLKFLGTLTSSQRQRAGIRGDRRITIDEFVSVMAWHDDNHLDQLKRALEGRP
jgi:DinB family protein